MKWVPPRFLSCILVNPATGKLSWKLRWQNVQKKQFDKHDFALRLSIKCITWRQELFFQNWNFGTLNISNRTPFFLCSEAEYDWNKYVFSYLISNWEKIISIYHNGVHVQTMWGSECLSSQLAWFIFAMNYVSPMSMAYQSIKPLPLLLEN